MCDCREEMQLPAVLLTNTAQGLTKDFLCLSHRLLISHLVDSSPFPFHLSVCCVSPQTVTYHFVF